MSVGQGLGGNDMTNWARGEFLHYRNRANIDKESFQTGYVSNKQRSLFQERSFQNVFCSGRRYAGNMSNREKGQDPTVLTKAEAPNQLPESLCVPNRLPTPSRKLMPISEPTRHQTLFRSTRALAFASRMNSDRGDDQFGH